MIKILAFVVFGLVAVMGMPEFSWDTPPVFVHMCQRSGAFNKSQVEYLARYPIVTIEKGQGIDTGNPAEYEIEKAAAQVKAANPKAYVIFYYNLVLDWAFYNAHQIMLKHPEWWLKDKEGNTVYLHGDASFPDHDKILVFDFSQKVVRDFWISEIVNATKTGNIDGAFGDRGCHGGVPLEKLAPSTAKAYVDGFYETLTGTQKAIGAEGLFIDNCLGKGGCSASQCPMPGVSAAQFEFFCKDLTGENKTAEICAEDIATLQQFKDRTDLVVEVHFYRNHLKDVNNIELPLAAFLIAASEYTYFGFSKGWYLNNDWDIWWPEYSKRLGKPLSDASKVGYTYQRAFEHAHVSLNLGTQTAKITWS